MEVRTELVFGIGSLILTLLSIYNILNGRAIALEKRITILEAKSSFYEERHTSHEARMGEYESNAKMLLIINTELKHIKDDLTDIKKVINKEGL